MSVIKSLFILFLVIAFISGIFICGTYQTPYLSMTDSSLSYYSYKEGLQDNSGNNNNNIRTDNDSCPDLLIRKGTVLLLYNSKMPEVEGINPIPFYNLDEYIYYLEIQRKNGMKCPVLYLQEEEGTQGQSTFRIRQSPFLPDGLPSNVDLYKNPIPLSTLTSGDDNPPYNANQHMSFDPYGQYIGRYTQLDAIHDATLKGSPISDNPMDSNWGGVLFTKSAVDSGKYKENEVAPPTSIGPWSLPSDNIRTSSDSDKLDVFA